MLVDLGKGSCDLPMQAGALGQIGRTLATALDDSSMDEDLRQTLAAHEIVLDEE